MLIGVCARARVCEEVQKPIENWLLQSKCVCCTYMCVECVECLLPPPSMFLPVCVVRDCRPPPEPESSPSIKKRADSLNEDLASVSPPSTLPHNPHPPSPSRCLTPHPPLQTPEEPSRVELVSRISKMGQSMLPRTAAEEKVGLLHTATPCCCLHVVLTTLSLLSAGEDGGGTACSRWRCPVHGPRDGTGTDQLPTEP